VSVTIRPFTVADTPALAKLMTAVYPEYPHPVEMIRHADSIPDPRCRTQRFLATYDGRVVGAGKYVQNPWTYHPQKFAVDFQVHPDYRRQGTGRALFQQVMQALAPFHPQQLRSKARVDREGGLAFLAHFGFVEVEQEWEYRLDPAGYDFTPYTGLETRLADQGIHIVTMADLMAHDPAYKEKLYALDTGEGPGEDEALTPPDFDLFVHSQFEPLIFLPAAYFVAVQDGRYIGVSNLESSGVADRLVVGYTGVDPAFRRQGIALALKLRTIRYAVAHGNPILITSSMSNNRPMIALNERLGFIRQPAWIRFKKDLTTP
jgi:GNAT superfamily N-acetyltransferase